MRTVTATGHGEARAVPDAVVVQVSAAHRASGVAEALAGADSAADQIVATAREHTTAERIGTTGLQLWHDHDPEGRAVGFVARHSLRIRCHDLAVAGSLLATLADEVGDRLEVENVALELVDRGAPEARARDAAYADAVDRATQLARLAGAELGDPQTVSEGGGLDGPRAVPVSASLKGTSLVPGEMAVGCSVTVTFQLR